MSLSIGIVGLPNVGKSTLFSLLTKKAVDTSNYPFATIDPNVGVVALPDERLQTLTNLSNSKRTIPTTIEFVDIAGLVAGAHAGEGLGNKFLANIREVDAIAHIIRLFPDPGVMHVSGSVDADRDKEIIELELALADLATIERRIKSMQGKAKTGSSEAKEQLALLERFAAALRSGKPVRSIALTPEEKTLSHELNLLTIKPVLYVLNVTEDNYSSVALPKGIQADEAVAVPLKLETELIDLSPAEAAEYRASLGMTDSAVDSLIKKSYALLNLITYLTTGPDETRAWTILRGTKAPQAAAKIHTDFEKKFIRAEVIDYQSLVAAGSWSAARERGLLRTEGKEYVVQEGDVIEFKI